MLTFFLVLAALPALFLALCYLCYWLAFRRHTERTPHPLHEDARFQAYAETLREGAAFYDTLSFTEVEIRSRDGLRLCGRFCGAARGKPLILLFHGYRSSDKRDFACALSFYLRQGYGLLLVDERAHGKSEGKTISFGVNERYDCQSWAEYAESRFHPADMYLDGISMGAATALMASDLALPACVRGIIADCGYTSPAAILRKVIRQIHLPVNFTYALLRVGARLFGGFDPEAAAATRALERCSIPVLFAHGEADNFVPCAMTRENYAHCAAPKTLITVPGAGHGFSYLTDRPRVEKALQEFFAQTRRGA